MYNGTLLAANRIDVGQDVLREQRADVSTRAGRKPGGKAEALTLRTPAVILNGAQFEASTLAGQSAVLPANFRKEIAKSANILPS
jgi:hypothetical protein